MKETFLEYYPIDTAVVWDKCLFVLDANVLLNLYRYSAQTRDDFFRVIEANRDRVWIPHQFGKEYHERRLDVIEKQRAAYDHVSGLLKSRLTTLSGELSEYQKHCLIDVKDIIAKIEKTVEDCCKEVLAGKDKHPDWFVSDAIRDRITNIFLKKVGAAYTPERITQIERDGAERFQAHTPPGFADEKKAANKFGDLIGWFQILDQAKTSKVPIILVTGDQKEDWWWKHSGKTVGPRKELKREMWNFAEVEFHMYTPERFIEFASKKIKINPDTIAEVKKIGTLTVAEMLTIAFANALTGSSVGSSAQQTPVGSTLLTQALTGGGSPVVAQTQEAAAGSQVQPVETQVVNAEVSGKETGEATKIR